MGGLVEGKSDPYAVLRVGTQVASSRVVHSELSPTWDEVYEVGIPGTPPTPPGPPSWWLVGTALNPSCSSSCTRCRGRRSRWSSLIKTPTRTTCWAGGGHSSEGGGGDMGVTAPGGHQGQSPPAGSIGVTALIGEHWGHGPRGGALGLVPLYGNIGVTAPRGGGMGHIRVRAPLSHHSPHVGTLGSQPPS